MAMGGDKKIVDKPAMHGRFREEQQSGSVGALTRAVSERDPQHCMQMLLRLLPELCDELRTRGLAIGEKVASAWCRRGDSNPHRRTPTRP